jgi:putative spermidine/putrescine transport system substrate-binding protein
VLGLGYDMQPPVLERAERELGLRIVSKAESPPVIQRLVRQQPASFDLFSCFQQDVAEFWASGSLRPVEIAKIRRWREITPLYKLGKAQRSKYCLYGQGDAAFRRLYVDPDRSGRWPSAPTLPARDKGQLVQWVDESTGRTVGREPRFCTGLPSCFNFDSFGYNAGILGKRPGEFSWAELLNGRWEGRVVLNASSPEVALQDTANAVQAARLMKLRDLGDPTRKEIDRLVQLLLAYRKQFFNVWVRGDEPVKWMQSGDVVLCTLYTAMIAQLASLGIPIHQSAPREGYRAFAGLVSISKEVRDPARLDACYAFLNWWHTGFLGAFLLKEGYYSAIQETTRRHVAPGEYAYWVDGKPADQTYPGPFGDVSVPKGRIRDGGSLKRKACRISSWNSTPMQDDYFNERWQEFVSTF